MTELIDGAKIKMGGKDWIVPALSFKQLKKLRPAISALNVKEMTDENMEIISSTVLAALKRNYPNVTIDEVEDMVDLRNAVKVFMAIMGHSGLERVTEGEAKPGNL